MYRKKHMIKGEGKCILKILNLSSYLDLPLTLFLEYTNEKKGVSSLKRFLPLYT